MKTTILSLMVMGGVLAVPAASFAACVTPIAHPLVTKIVIERQVIKGPNGGVKTDSLISIFRKW